MKRSILPVTIAATLLFLVFPMTGGGTAEAAKPAGKAVKVSCVACHANLASVLPKNHPEAKGNDIMVCTTCHKPDASGKAAKNGFSAKMHLAHLPPKGNLDCKACHAWSPGKSFNLIGGKGSLGSPKSADMELMQQVFASWASSGYTDNLHAKANIACSGCHGKDLPKPDEAVENGKCLECHGPMEKLAKRSEPKDFADRNPHKSHLGEIACTVCHHLHAESKVYCLDCHRNFNMKIPGGANP